MLDNQPLDVAGVRGALPPRNVRQHLFIFRPEEYRQVLEAPTIDSWSIALVSCTNA